MLVGPRRWTHIIVARQKLRKSVLVFEGTPLIWLRRLATFPMSPSVKARISDSWMAALGNEGTRYCGMTNTHFCSALQPIRNDWQCLVPSPFTDLPTCHAPLWWGIPLPGSNLPRSHKMGPPWPISWLQKDVQSSPLLSTSLVTPWPSRLLPGYSHHPHPVSSYSLNGVQFWSGAYDKLSSGPALEDSCTHLKHI